MAISAEEAIQIPFSSGTSDRSSINETQNPPNDTVSWSKGFTPNYSLPINAGGKLVQRKDFNALFYKLSKAIRYFQVGGVATFGTVFGTTAKKGSIYWHEVDGRWLIIEAKTDNASTANFNQSEWNCYTFLDYVNGKPSIKELTVTDQLTIGTGIKIGGGIARGCPTPTQASDFANKQYVDRNSSFLGGAVIARDFNVDTPHNISKNGGYEVVYTAEKNCLFNFYLYHTGNIGDTSVIGEVAIELRVNGNPVMSQNNYRAVISQEFSVSGTLKKGDVVTFHNTQTADLVARWSWCANEIRI